jgi:2-(1,2-epoxy-1,2-dihydrophenyl)acetyl-CoA isomerase
MAEALAAITLSLAQDDSVSALVFTGAGKAFFAGGDLKWMAGFPQGPAAALHELAGRFHVAIQEIRRMRKPVIAAINGVAAGAGFSLALACDFRVMAKSATLKQAYTSVGLSIDGGGTFTLPRLVGLARALEIAAFDKTISSEKALEWGLVTKVVEDQQVVEEAMTMARELAKISLHSFGWCKQLLTDSFDSSLETHLERERRGISNCAGHPDGREGIKAFLEKRKPNFSKKK